MLFTNLPNSLKKVLSVLYGDVKLIKSKCKDLFFVYILLLLKYLGVVCQIGFNHDNDHLHRSCKSYFNDSILIYYDI